MTGCRSQIKLDTRSYLLEKKLQEKANDASEDTRDSFRVINPGVFLHE